MDDLRGPDNAVSFMVCRDRVDQVIFDKDAAMVSLRPVGVSCCAQKTDVHRIVGSNCLIVYLSTWGEEDTYICTFDLPRPLVTLLPCHLSTLPPCHLGLAQLNPQLPLYS
jgi:hypothetical protein